MTKARFLFGSLACFCIASFAIASADLKRIVRQMKPGELQLHVLLEKALNDPGQSASADALAHFVEAWKLQKMPASGKVRTDHVGGVTYHVRFGGKRWGNYLPLIAKVLTAILQESSNRKIPHWLQMTIDLENRFKRHGMKPR